MRAAQRAFWERRKDDATKSVGEHMSTSEAFSFLKFYQHVFSFCKITTFICHYAAENKNAQKFHVLPSSGGVWM